MTTQNPLIGQQLGNYLIQEALGYGGMAHVYKGFDVGLKRTVAVKITEEPPGVRSTLSQRFEHEAEAVAQLRHPNIVSVYYFGRHDHLYYLVMEYIDGVTLDTVMHHYEVNQELMPHKDVLHILEAIASALDYAHANGVIHRDVKPSNIMIDQAGRPILTDFGLALSLSKGSVGEIFGTPHYISPEQAVNSATAIPQSDLYSLGIIAFELLTGSVPFTDSSLTALAVQHLLTPVPSPLRFNPDLAKQVESVLFKVLAKEPSDRYQTGSEFIGALRKALERSGSRTTVVASAVRADSESPLDVLPRRLSMQTALDKVGQEMALRNAKGQDLTRMPRMDDPTLVDPVGTAPLRDPSAKRQRLLLLVVLTMGAILFAFAGLALTRSRNDQAATRTPVPTRMVNVSVSDGAPTLIPATVSDLVFAATSTSERVLVPTAVEPPTQSSEETAAITPETTADSGLPVRFIYNDDTFYWLNDSDRNINARPMVFERVDDSQRFPGSQWRYRILEPGQCMEIRFADVAGTNRPDNCRPNSVYTTSRGLQAILFWTGSGQFRVLWRGSEIAVCEIEAGECTAVIPTG